MTQVIELDAVDRAEQNRKLREEHEYQLALEWGIGDLISRLVVIDPVRLAELFQHGLDSLHRSGRGGRRGRAVAKQNLERAVALIDQDDQ